MFHRKFSIPRGQLLVIRNQSGKTKKPCWELEFENFRSYTQFYKIQTIPTIDLSDNNV